MFDFTEYAETIMQLGEKYDKVRHKPSDEIAQYIAHLVSEIGEFYQCVKKNKPLEEQQEEATDIVMISIHIAGLSGLSGEQLKEKIDQKFLVIKERMRTGEVH